MRGRLEARITIPAGNWAFSATNGGGGPSAGTVSAGAYAGLTALCAAFQTALNATRPSGWTVSLSGGESGTGLVTINCSSTPWSLTWTSPDLQTVLGFSANPGTDFSTKSSPTVALKQSASIWMPDCSYWAPLDLTQEIGPMETDFRSTESPDGAVKSLFGNSKRVVEGMRWDAISQNVARNISTTVTGFELFYTTTQLASASYHVVGDYVYLFPNADSASNNRYKIVGLTDSKYPQSVNGWTGRYRIVIPRLVNS